MLASRQRLILLLVSAAAGPLFLVGLGSTVLWTDEAQTALLARSVLQYGLPLTGTGADSVSAHCGEEAGLGGAHLQVPWLQAYLAAASMVLLGSSAAAARLPFAMLGWACVPLSAWTAAQAGGRAFARIVAALLTGSSVYFLLHARQARYYGLAAALVLIAVGAYLRLIRGRGRSWQVALPLTALVLAFDITALGVIGGLGAHWSWQAYTRAPTRRRTLSLILRSLLLPVSTLGLWILVASTAASRRGIRLGSLIANPVYYAVQLNAHVLPLILVGPLVAWLWWRGDLRGRRARDLAAIGLVAAAAVAAACLAPRTFPRYVIAIVPLLLTALALLLERGASRGRAGATVAAGLVSLVMIGTPHKISNDLVRGAAALVGRQRLHPVEPWRPALVPFVRELADPPRGPIAAVSEYLNAYADEGDVVVTTYGVPALRFHTGLDVFGGRTCALPTRRVPQWVWIRPGWGGRTSELAATWIRDNVDLDEYEQIELAVPDRRFENREDIHEHVFDNPGPAAPPVVLYRARRAR